MSKIRAWAATKPGKLLVSYECQTGKLGSDEVEVKVEYCEFFHSDISAITMSSANDAISYLVTGKPRCRILAKTVG